MYKDGVNKWTVTVEKDIQDSNALSELQSEMWNRFGLNTTKYSESFVDIKRLSPINLLPEKFITPFLVKFKSAIAFESKITDKFSAILWNDLVRDIMKNSIYIEDGKCPKHSQTSIVIMKELHTRGVFN
jgi:hypothetical protein